MKPVVAIDTAGCWGCKSCEVACKQEHDMPPGVKLIRVTEEKPRAVHGKLTFSYKPVRCVHCDDPPCVPACPKGAIRKDERTGIVLIDDDKCDGCGHVKSERKGADHADHTGSSERRITACMKACPYAAISFDHYEGKARKCDMCYFRVTNGLIPACADNVCLAHCVYFGDRKDIDRTIGEKPWLKYRKEGKLKQLVIRIED